MSDTRRVSTCRFEIEGLACSQLLSRVVGYVAQRDLVVERLRADRHGDRLHVAFTIDGVGPHCAEILAAKLRAVVTVERVDLTYGRLG